MSITTEMYLRMIGCFVLLILSISAPLIALYIDIRPATEPLNIWFQRSGSIVVLFALSMEFELYKLNSLINPTGWVGDDVADLNEKYSWIIDRLKVMGAMVATGGTVIWGYGDILL